MQTWFSGAMILYLFHHFDTSSQVHTEVHHFPVNTFTNIFLLLEHEHVMIEKLLQLFVGEVDAELLEAIELTSASGNAKEAK